MDILDQPQCIKEIDKESMLRHILELPDQIEQAWADMQNFVIPAPYLKAKNVLILGMGGSGIGGLLVEYLAYSQSKVPVKVIREYELPAYVNSDSLVIASSYSGNTEETLAAFEEAAKKQAKLLAITMGGELASKASKYKAPVYKVEYGSPPRAAIGYSFTVVLAILHKLGFIELGKDDIREAIVLMKGMRTKFVPEVPTYQNEAKKLARKLEKSLPVVIGSGIMYPVAYRWAGQLGENSKHVAFSLPLPELCHNWLVGLTHEIDKLYIMILQSKFDNPRNRLRQNIISQLLNKKNIRHELVFLQPSGSILSEQLLTVYFGDFVSYYLAILHNVNPTSIEEVNYLKINLENATTN
jgi:glucose/mannose-6-phosphate isomerase